MKQRLLNHSGFTLIEIAIASAIISLAAIIVASIIKHGAEQRAYSEKRVATVALASTINESLRIIEACDRTLGASSSVNAQIVNEGQLQQDGSVATNGWQIALALPEIHTGVAMTGTTLSATAPNNIIPERRLQIDSLKLADGRRLPDVGLNRRYIATIYLKTSEIGGMPFRENPIGSTIITIDQGTGRGAPGGGATSSSFQNTCVEMGCTFDPLQTPPCRCLRSQVVCSAPGAVPVAFTSEGYPTCIQTGGEDSCPAGEYLAGFGIGYKECVALPTAAATPTPAPTPSCPAGSCCYRADPQMAWSKPSYTCAWYSAGRDFSNPIIVPTGDYHQDSNNCLLGNPCHGTLAFHCDGATGGITYLPSTSCDTGDWP
jgi:prepilin-type N-terminal cleavage/methylation domain-containing protein